MAHDSARKIAVSGKSGLKTEVDVDVKGSFSSMLPSDTYSISVQSTPVDRQMGIVFAPVVLDVNVKDSPVNDLNFSQVSFEPIEEIYSAGDIRLYPVENKLEQDEKLIIDAGIKEKLREFKKVCDTC